MTRATTPMLEAMKANTPAGPKRARKKAIRKLEKTVESRLQE